MNINTMLYNIYLNVQVKRFQNNNSMPISLIVDKQFFRNSKLFILIGIGIIGLIFYVTLKDLHCVSSHARVTVI